MGLVKGMSVLMAGAIGIFHTYKEGLFKNRREPPLIIFVILAVSFAQSLYYIDNRHRWFIDPIFDILLSKVLILFLELENA